MDAHVTKYILEECLTKRLKDKTRVLVTHKLESLKYVDYVYILKSGEIVAQGNFEEIKQTPSYQEIEEKANKERQQEEEGEKEEEESLEINPKLSLKRTSNRKNFQASVRRTQRKETSYHEGQEEKKLMEKLMLNEDRQTGSVTWAIWVSFFKYFSSVQYLLVLITGKITHIFPIYNFIGIICWIGLKTLSDFWLAHWSNNSETDTERGNGYYYGIYMVLTLSSVSLLFVRMGMSVIGGIQVSKKLHFDMFKRIIRAPINLFFDRVPLGRLINRFAGDLDTIDNVMPFTVSKITFMPIELLSKIIVCCIVGTIWVLPFAFLFVWTGFKVQRKYFSVYSEAFRLCNSPYIFSY